MRSGKATASDFLQSLPSALRQINALGAERQPFFFMVDYAATQAMVVPLSEWPHDGLSFAFSGRTGSEIAPLSVGMKSEDAAAPSQMQWQTSPPPFGTYEQAFQKVQRHLHRGDSFLTNLTFAVPVRTNLTLSQLYFLARAPYKVLWPDEFVCFSPEPFVEIVGGRIRTFPMKGTIDAMLPQAAQRLLHNPKERAEHATIVDLLRNDLSQIASEVHVARYRYVEQISTHRGALLQTSSEIVGTLPHDHLDHLGDLLKPLLPAGSITGAPKLATLQSIAEAEDYDRKFYTGIMGCFDGASLQSAVMIRFVEAQPDGSFVYKAGGGITTRSDVQSEYEELLAKVYAPL